MDKSKWKKPDVREVMMRIEMLRGIDLFVRCLNDGEFMYDSWLMCGVPDGSTFDDLLDIATDNESFYDVMQVFINHACKKGIRKDGVFMWDSNMLIVGSEFEREEKENV